MSDEPLRNQLFALIDAMHQALDQHRWRKMPGLHQQLMATFDRYQAQETSALALAQTKQALKSAYSAILARREQRADELKARMDKLQRDKEGVLAYSMVNLFSEQQ